MPTIPWLGAAARASEPAGFVAAEWPAPAGAVAVPVGLRASASSRPAGLRLLPAASVWLWEGPRERLEHLGEADDGRAASPEGRPTTASTSAPGCGSCCSRRSASASRPGACWSGRTS